MRSPEEGDSWKVEALIVAFVFKNWYFLGPFRIPFGRLE